eukprot:1154959-Pelagomonas_calceolata.AAC.2
MLPCSALESRKYKHRLWQDKLAKRLWRIDHKKYKSRASADCPGALSGLPSLLIIQSRQFVAAGTALALFAGSSGGHQPKGPSPALLFYIVGG